MFTAAFFRIAKRWNQPKCPLMDELDKQNVVCGILLSLKKKEILSHVITWMNLEDIK